MRNNRADTQLYKKYIAQLANAYRTRSDLRMFTELLLTVVAIFVFSVFAIRPTLVTIGGLTTEIGEKEQTIKTMDTKIDNIIAAQQVFANETPRLVYLDTAVPHGPEITEYIRLVETVASNHQTSVYTMSSNGIPVADVPGDGQEKTITISFTITGSYPDLMATLTDIETLRRPLQFSEGSLSLDESEDVSRLFLTMTGAIPYFPIMQLTLPQQ